MAFTRLLFIIFFYFFSATGCGQILSKYTPLIESLNSSRTKTNLTKLLKEKEWNTLFPHRYSLGQPDSLLNKKDFYSFTAFIKAAKLFPGFLSEGTLQLQKRELAAFLANIAQETSGGWKEAPGGYFKWGLYYLEEIHNQDLKEDYVDSTWKRYKAIPGKFYYGRGPKQFSWNYNYGQFSEAWYGDMDTLLRNPERLSLDPVLSFASAIWFWMTPQKPKPSCHDIMVGNWIPTDDDILKNRMPGFGSTVNVINGGVECGTSPASERTAARYAYYLYFCQYFKVNPGENLDCNHQTPFGK